MTKRRSMAVPGEGEPAKLKVGGKSFTASERPPGIGVRGGRPRYPSALVVALSAAGKFAPILAKSLTPATGGGRPAPNRTHFVRGGGSLRHVRHNQTSFCWTSGAEPRGGPSARRGIFWNEGRTCVPGTPGYGSSIHRSIYEISLNNGRIGYGTSSRKAAKLLDRPACVAHSPFRRLALGGSRICCSKLLVFTELG